MDTTLDSYSKGCQFEFIHRQARIKHPNGVLIVFLLWGKIQKLRFHFFTKFRRVTLHSIIYSKPSETLK